MVLHSSNETPLIVFEDSVSQQEAKEMRSFFDEIAARLAKNELRAASLLVMEQQRDENCKLIEFQDYGEYWESPFWKTIRRKVLKRDKRVCLVCQGKASQVHHRSYSLEVLKGEDLSQLVSICEGCHKVLHWDEWGYRRSIDEWDAVLFTRNLSGDFPVVENTDRAGRSRHPAWKRMSAVQRANWKASL